MENLYFQSQEHFSIYLRSLEFIGSGSESDCYKTANNLVLKHLCGPAYEPKTKEELLQFKDVAIKNYVFNKALVYIKDEIVGVLMPYINGRTLEKNLYKVKILNIVRALDDLMIATKKLSNLGIHVFDVCDVNTIYNNSKFFLIDTMFYEKVAVDPNQLFRQNMKSIIINIYEKIIPYEILVFISTIDEIKDFVEDTELLINPSYVLKVLLDELNKYMGIEVKTMEEASKKLIKS